MIKKLLELYMRCELNRLPNEMLMSETILWSGAKWHNYRDCLSRVLLKNTTGRTNKRAIKFNLELQYMKCLKILPYDCIQMAGIALANQCHWYKYEAEKNGGHRSVWDLIGGPTITGNHHADKYMQNAFRKYVKCIRTQEIQSSLQHCLPEAVHQCQSSKIIAAKILRMNLGDFGTILSEHTNWKVVHQIRDPRAVLISQREIQIMSTQSNGSMTREANVVCNKILNDLRSLKQLNRFNRSQVLLVKYEDYANSPISVMKKVYCHINENLSNQVISQVSTLTRSKYDSGAMYQLRINSSATARGWIGKIRIREKMQIDHRCEVLYKESGYSTHVV